MSPTFLALALTVTAPALKEKPPADPPLVGRWAAASIVVNGKASTTDGLEYEFTADGKWVIYRNGVPLDGNTRSYTATGGAIDLTERRSPYPGVFKVDKDTLTICFRHDGADRPKDVSAGGEGLMTFVLSRVKAKR